MMNPIAEIKKWVDMHKAIFAQAKSKQIAVQTTFNFELDDNGFITSLKAASWPDRGNMLSQECLNEAAAHFAQAWANYYNDANEKSLILGKGANIVNFIDAYNSKQLTKKKA